MTAEGRLITLECCRHRYKIKTDLFYREQRLIRALFSSHMCNSSPTTYSFTNQRHCYAPYAYTGSYTYGTSHTPRILIWDAHTRIGQHLVPYKYFICMFYFFTGFDYCCYKSITRDLQMKAQRVKVGIASHDL